MVNDRDQVAREAHVKFYGISVQLDGTLERKKGVLVKFGLSAAVRTAHCVSGAR